MWWNEQNFGQPIVSKQGIQWEFKVWHGYEAGIYIQRIYFWDKFKQTTGLLVFTGDQTIHKTKLKDKMIKLANDSVFRSKYLSELVFPIEKNYT